MKRSLEFIPVYLLIVAWILYGGVSSTYAQNGGMTCVECHADPSSGGFHGGFRYLGGLTDEQMEVICISCHDGSYTNPQGVLAPEAAVHENKNPGAGRDQYGDFKATCLDCHTTHNGLLAGDGTTAIVPISSDPNFGELHVIETTTESFLLDEALVTESSIVITDVGGVPFIKDVDYDVSLLGGDPRKIVLLDGGSIKGASLTVLASYEFAANQQLLGVEVIEASSTDDLARIRQPFIVDPNGDDSGSGRSRFQENYQSGTYASSGIPDDPGFVPDQVRELTFHQDVKTAGTNWVPGGTTGPFNGACNSCHTRTAHHRRNNLGEFGGGDDHTHNATKNCDQCHSHNAGWVNKGG